MTFVQGPTRLSVNRRTPVREKETKQFVRRTTPVVYHGVPLTFLEKVKGSVRRNSKRLRLTLSFSHCTLTFSLLFLNRLFFFVFFLGRSEKSHDENLSQGRTKTRALGSHETCAPGLTDDLSGGKCWAVVSNSSTNLHQGQR